MDSAPQDPTPPDPVDDLGQTDDLSLTDAAALYAVSARTLAQHIRCGTLPAHKTPGATGRQWRVTRTDLDAAGYTLRPTPTPDEATTAAADPLVTQLRRQLHATQREAAAERRRADDLDRRLGHAMLEAGHLRAALSRATGATPDPTIDLEAQTTRQLVRAVRDDLRQFE